MTDDIKPNELKSRLPVILVIVGLLLIVINVGVFVWKSKKTAPPVAKPQPEQVAEPEKETPTPIGNFPAKEKWGEAYPGMPVPGRKE